eukprot:3587733-Pleurochrysis_carterae.AAC.1
MVGTTSGGVCKTGAGGAAGCTIIQLDATDSSSGSAAGDSNARRSTEHRACVASRRGVAAHQRLIDAGIIIR